MSDNLNAANNIRFSHFGSLFNEPMRLETIRQEPIKDPARFPWQKVSKVANYWLEVSAMTRLMLVREDGASYGKEDQ